MNVAEMIDERKYCDILLIQEALAMNRSFLNSGPSASEN